MKDTQPKTISVHVTINEPLERVWQSFITPDDIVKWNTASSDWHTPTADNDLRPGGRFNYRMEARDGSMGFDFWGIYDQVQPFSSIEYTLGDGRKVQVKFLALGQKTEVLEIFETENENPAELQLNGWQAILNNFKYYVETY